MRMAADRDGTLVHIFLLELDYGLQADFAKLRLLQRRSKLVSCLVSNPQIFHFMIMVQ